MLPSLNIFHPTLPPFSKTNYTSLSPLFAIVVLEICKACDLSMKHKTKRYSSVVRSF